MTDKVTHWEHIRPGSASRSVCNVATFMFLQCCIRVSTKMDNEWFRERHASLSGLDWPPEPELNPTEAATLDLETVDSASVSDPVLHVHGQDGEAQARQGAHWG